MEKISFFDLDVAEKKHILQTISLKTGKTEQILEKDIWICWVLDKLFTMPDAFSMAFKGGTSLSKVFNLINRFSEDIDITIDYKNFKLHDPFDKELSTTKRKKILALLKEKMAIYVSQRIVPHLKKVFADTFKEELDICANDNGEKVEVYYPSVCNNALVYIKPYVLIEFGARNVVDPSEYYSIRPYLSNYLNNLKFPVAKVNVLSAERTFWEKVTLIHVECFRDKFHQGAHRLSRHWYDLFRLVNSKYGEGAIKNIKLLQDVVSHKKIFFNASYANYDFCLNNKFQLIPQGNNLDKLELDYLEMIKSNMFYDTPISFNEIHKGVLLLEKRLNHM